MNIIPLLIWLSFILDKVNAYFISLEDKVNPK